MRWDWEQLEIHGIGQQRPNPCCITLHGSPLETLRRSHLPRSEWSSLSRTGMTSSPPSEACSPSDRKNKNQPNFLSYGSIPNSCITPTSATAMEIASTQVLVASARRTKSNFVDSAAHLNTRSSTATTKQDPSIFPPIWPSLKPRVSSTTKAE